MPSQTMSTYSIIGYDPRMQELGVAVQSKFLAVGALVPWVEAKDGAVVTQARTNGQYRLTVLHELKQGKVVENILRQVIAEDPDSQTRQIGIICRTSFWMDTNKKEREIPATLLLGMIIIILGIIYFSVSIIITI